MTDHRQWYAGVDWASQWHHVFLTDEDGAKIGEKAFAHGGEGLAEMAAWLTTTSGAEGPDRIMVAIEVPHGPVVETLIERGLTVQAINPKQGCWSPSATSRRPKPRNATTPCGQNQAPQRDSNETASNKPGAVQSDHAGIS